jgi:hypothetical protein
LSRECGFTRRAKPAPRLGSYMLLAPGCRAYVDRLLGRLGDRPARADGANDVPQIPDASSQAVDPGDHQNVAGVEEPEHRAERLVAFRGSAAPLSGAERALGGPRCIPFGRGGARRSLRDRCRCRLDLSHDADFGEASDLPR